MRFYHNIEYISVCYLRNLCSLRNEEFSFLLITIIDHYKSFLSHRFKFEMVHVIWSFFYQFFLLLCFVGQGIWLLIQDLLIGIKWINAICHSFLKTSQYLNLKEILTQTINKHKVAKDQWCIITGANSGIGKATAEIMCSIGYNVIFGVYHI